MDLISCSTHDEMGVESNIIGSRQATADSAAALSGPSENQAVASLLVWSECLSLLPPLSRRDSNHKERSDDDTNKLNINHFLSNRSHATVLIATAERMRRQLRVHRHAVTVLATLPAFYDQSATSLLKAGQTLPKGVRPTKIQESLVFGSGETSRLSRTIQTVLQSQLLPLMHGQSVVLWALMDKYTLNRNKCLAVSQRTRIIYHQLKAAATECEQILRMSSSPSIPSSKLDNLQRFMISYPKWIAWERECVTQYQVMEQFVLETLQQMDFDRLTVVATAFKEMLLAYRVALSEIKLAMEGAMQPSIPVLHDSATASTSNEILPSVSSSSSLLLAPPSPVSGGLVANAAVMAQQNSADVNSSATGTGAVPPPVEAPTTSTEETSPVVPTSESDALDLPTEIMTLRRTVRTRIAARMKRVRSFQVLARLFQYVQAALEVLGTQLPLLVTQLDERTPTSSPTHVETREYLFWHTWKTCLEAEAKEALQSMQLLKKTAKDKIDTLVIYGEKLLKAASDSEEAVWRQLCEAVRTKNKAEVRYIQTCSEQMKARERVSSVDGDSSKIYDTTPMLVSKNISRSLANVFSVLPNGGEHAMKLLSSSTVASIAQHTLEDADEKEGKTRQVLDEATVAVSRLMAKYQTNARGWLKQFDSEDSQGWGDISTPLQLLLSCIQESRDRIISKMQELPICLSESDVADSMNRWVIMQNETLKATSRNGQSAADDSQRSESVSLSPTLISMLKTESNVLDSKEDLEVEYDGADSDLGASDDDLPMPNSSRENSVSASDAKGSFFTSQYEGDESQSSLQDDDDNRGINWLANSVSKLSFIGRKTRRRHKRLSNVSPLTEIFATYFGHDKPVDPQLIPAVTDSFSCFLDDGAIDYGRIFVTELHLVFVSWSGKRLSLRHDDEILHVDPVLNPFTNVDDTLKVKFKKADSEHAVTVRFCGFLDRQLAFNAFQRSREDARAKAALVAATKAAESQIIGKSQHETDRTKDGARAGALPPDSILSKMDVVIKQHLRNISVTRFYEIVWSEGTSSAEKPLYGPFLTESCLDVQVGPWEIVDCIGPWDQETYQQKRMISYRVQRKTHLYIGPPIADVHQVQYCRVEGQDKCVLSMTVETRRIPYSDTFEVEVRWVARREGTKDLSVEVGVFVNFKKSSLLQGKIRSATTEETTSVHNKLFERVKRACIEAGGEETTEIVEDDVVPKPPPPSSSSTTPGRSVHRLTVVCILIATLLYGFVRIRSRPRNKATNEKILSNDVTNIEMRLGALEGKIHDLQNTMREVLEILKEQRRNVCVQ